jgi:hypothetical protein
MEILADKQYTLNDFYSIANNMDKITLDDNIIHMINNITTKVGAAGYQKTPIFKKNYKSKYKKATIKAEDWSQIRQFKTTKLKKNEEGFESEVDKIRSNLNKLTKSNYDEILHIMIHIINNVMNYKTYEKKHLMEISNIIFDIGCANIFLSKIYADIYRDITIKFDSKKNIYEDVVNEYLNSFKNLKYFELKENYELFCEENKNRDLRKAKTKFLINLLLNKTINGETIIKIIKFLENKINELLNIENKKNELEEIFDNLSILILNGYNVLKIEPCFDDIIDNLNVVSNLEADAYKSLSNKIIFKCSDILEEIEDM